MLGGKNRANTERSEKDDSTFDIVQPSKLVIFLLLYMCGVLFYMTTLSSFLALLISWKRSASEAEPKVRVYGFFNLKTVACWVLDKLFVHC